VGCDGTISVSSGTPGSMNGLIYLTTAKPGGDVAFVFPPHALITLSGTGVTPHSARATGRSLRPV
jgi:hypothetical protein